MIVFQNECVGCPPEMGCLGSSCLFRNVEHHYCDECECDDQLYYFDDRELCIECIKEILEEVKIE